MRATTAGTYSVAPAHAEEMYEPEVFGRTATTAIDVKPVKTLMALAAAAAPVARWLVASVRWLSRCRGRRAAPGPPPPGLLDEAAAVRSTTVLDRNGEVLYEARSDLGTREMRLEAVSPAACAGGRDAGGRRSPLLHAPRRRSDRDGARGVAERARPRSRRRRLDAHAAGGQAPARSPRASWRPVTARRSRCGCRRSTRRSSRCGSSIG